MKKNQLLSIIIGVSTAFNAINFSNYSICSAVVEELTYGENVITSYPVYGDLSLYVQFVFSDSNHKLIENAEGIPNLKYCLYKENDNTNDEKIAEWSQSDVDEPIKRQSLDTFNSKFSRDVTLEGGKYLDKVDKYHFETPDEENLYYITIENLPEEFEAEQMDGKIKYTDGKFKFSFNKNNIIEDLFKITDSTGQTYVSGENWYDELVIKINKKPEESPQTTSPITVSSVSESVFGSVGSTIPSMTTFIPASSTRPPVTEPPVTSIIESSSYTDTYVSYSDIQYVLGDINNDNEIDLTDLSELSLAIIGDKTLTDAQLKAADINGNGEADLTDLARMKQYISKVITSLR